ncbi:hypothetical protein HHK36_025090 [Tetracentron sinense]|uniref:Uncharacterized protein n=1 Tax=Tetracentron sinense TaxID=13715 RepID=A0A834YQ90_TETSI|nr:hypothetical protein HHK36_025090 [Tetracentron sinense]
MELQAFVLIAISSLGLISLCKTLFTLSRWVWVTFFRAPKNLKDYGSWAVITGSTDGIGKALAFELAAKGLNLVLIGRDASKLETTSKEIREIYGRSQADHEVKKVVIDFSEVSGEEMGRRIEEEIEGLDVGILINNAGIANRYAMFFHEVESVMVERIMKVNVDGATWVTKAVLPGMLKKKKGAIVYIGSGYIAMFSRCISLEYKQHGIDIQCQTPLLVATKMTKIKRSSFFTPSPEAYSRASVRWIGYESLCVPYWPHSIHWIMMRALPDALVNRGLLHYFLGMRKRGQLKDSMKNEKKNP